MGIGSIVIGIAAFLFMFGGIIFSLVPVLGWILSFLAPILAIAGTVVGGLGVARARRDGLSSGSATAGIIVNVIAFIPALIVAATCGMCNACFSSDVMDPRNRGWVLDAGPSWDTSDAGSVVDPGSPPPEGAPPPAWPPPPMAPAGPGAAGSLDEPGQPAPATPGEPPVGQPAAGGAAVEPPPP